MLWKIWQGKRDVSYQCQRKRKYGYKKGHSIVSADKNKDYQCNIAIKASTKSISYTVYANDVIIFRTPVIEEKMMTQEVLNDFKDEKQDRKLKKCRKQRRQRSSKKSRRLRKIDRECRYNSEYLKMTLSRCRIYIFRDFRRWNSFENGCCRQEGFLQAKRYENWFSWNWLEQLDYCSKQFWCILLCWPMRICWDTGFLRVNQRSS